jgi:hypothetical protein
MKLTVLRNTRPRGRFPVYISNAGRSHEDATQVAQLLSDEWDVRLSYKPDANGSKQGIFSLDAMSLSDLEVEGVHYLIHKTLQCYPQAYDVANP